MDWLECITNYEYQATSVAVLLQNLNPSFGCRWGPGSLCQRKKMFDKAERKDGGRGTEGLETLLFRIPCIKCKINVYGI